LGIAVEIVDGLSFIESALTALHLDALDGLQIVDALDVATAHHPRSIRSFRHSRFCYLFPQIPLQATRLLQ